MGISKVFKCELEIVECLVNSPIGKMIVKSCKNGIHQLSQIDEIDDSNFSPDSETKVEMLSDHSFSTGHPAVACFQWLKMYFEQPFEVFPKPPLCLPAIHNSTYHQRVWITLSNDVKVGETVSYLRLAEMTENPKAARAVGTAMMLNPFLLVVPCHRVIRSDGNIGLFAHGRRQKVKRWLLEHEKAI